MINSTLPAKESLPFGDEWQIECELGRGSYGVVYRISRKDDNGMISAMKWIPLPEDNTQVSRMLAEGGTMTGVREYYSRLKGSFIEEIKLLTKLRGNSHIVSLEDYKVIPREGIEAIGYDIYIRMELLTSLTEYMNNQALTYSDILQLGQDLCSALSDCRHYNIIHRDIKPDNIFVTEGRRFKLGDFGIARQLQQDNIEASQRVGSLAYMAPEVYHAQTYDHRADIYSLGLVLYKLLNGHRDPFIPDNVSIITPDEEGKALAARMSGKAIPIPKNLPESLVRLSDILKKACSFDPDARYQTPEEMREALSAVQDLPGLDVVILKPRNAHSTTADSQIPPQGSGNTSGTIKRTPSSIYNETDPRTSKVPESTPKEEKKDDEGEKSVADDDNPNPIPKPRPLNKKALIIITVSVLVLALGAFLIFFHPGKTANYKVTAGSITPTSATISWDITNPKEDAATEVKLRLLNNNAVVKEEAFSGKSIVLSGLIPSTEYTVELTLNGETASTVFHTLNETAVSELPLIKQVDLTTVDRDFLGRYNNLSDVPEKLFSFLPDNQLHLITAHMSRQPYSIVLWIMFGPSQTSASSKLMMALSPENGPLYSDEITLQFKESETNQSFRISLDQLLDKVYSATNNWPAGTSSLRLYLDGMSVYSLDLGF